MSASPSDGTRKRPAPRGTAAYPRKRANKACQVCRARRTKCDNKRPKCGFCEKAGTNCTWAPQDLSSFDPASLAILERFDRLESLLFSSGKASLLDHQTSPGTVTVSSPSQREIGSRLGCVQSSLINVRLEAVLQWQPIRVLVNSVVPPTKMVCTPVAFHQLAGSLSDEFNMSTCNALLENFWRGVHSKNPILNKDEVKRFMHQVCLDGISWDAQSCLVLLVCALGTLATEFGPASPGQVEERDLKASDRRRVAQAQPYFAAAQKRLGVCLGRRGILEAQCFFYCGVYLSTMMQPEAAWSMFLQALACCQGFRCLAEAGLDIGSSSPPDYELDSVTVAEESTYWTCLKSEIESHLDVSPPGFRTIDLWYPRKFPDPPRNSITDTDRSWFFYLAEIALRRLANRIMAFISKGLDLNNPQETQSAYESAAEFEQEAQDWIQSLPSPNELERYQDDVLNFILKGHLLNCYELIYWPFVKHAVNGGQQDQKSDEYIKKGLQVAADRIAINQPGFKHRHHGTYGMIKSVTRSTFVLLAACHSNRLQHLMPVGWLELLPSVDDLLEFWEDEIAAAASWREMMKLLVEEAQT
ncbi:hypothetical protein IFR04_003861 [Cadophora malorum]|uniref:Zn(2)-C6 fungal-type domain-containing protein n=1 Tax=Cadophora malorum TaxID=108018 RepID=A0A8H8BTA0_9HELO|nr:hypothetical protein IFR04_003861 [Cadophora malorum]